ARSPPGMMLGPSSAPSSPPDTPVPMKRRPRSAQYWPRLRVSWKCELPPSMMMSPSSSSGTSSSITLSTGAPAFTMTMILRGRSSAWTNSSMLSLPVKAPSFPKSARNFLVRSEVRLCTATGNPCLAMLRARLAPMTASPVTPMRLPPVIVAAPSLRSDHVSVRCLPALILCPTTLLAVSRRGPGQRRRSTDDLAGKLSPWGRPLPLADLRHVLPVGADVLAVFDELVAQPLPVAPADGLQLRYPIDDVDGEVEPVDPVQHAHVEGSGGRALLDVAADVQVVMVGATVGQPVDQPRIAVVGEDDGLVGREEGVELPMRQPVWVLLVVLQPHEVDHVHDPDA